MIGVKRKLRRRSLSLVFGFLVAVTVSQLFVSKCCSRLSRVGGVYLYCSVVFRCLFSMVFGWAINCRCGTNVEWDALAHALGSRVDDGHARGRSSNVITAQTHTRMSLWVFVFIVWLFCVLCVSMKHKHKHNSDYYLSGTRHTRTQQYYHHLMRQAYVVSCRLFVLVVCLCVSHSSRSLWALSGLM